MSAMHHTEAWRGTKQHPAAGRAWHTSCFFQHTQCNRSRIITRIHKALDKQGKTLLSTPGEVTLECLTLMRTPHISTFRAYLEPSLQPSSAQAAELQGRDGVLLTVGHLNVTETGPLATLHTHLDAAARRMLPRHLLRRCRVLSSLQLGDTCRQRVTITARTGEEACFVVQLRQSNTEQAANDTKHSETGLQAADMHLSGSPQVGTLDATQPPDSRTTLQVSSELSQHTSHQRHGSAVSPINPPSQSNTNSSSLSAARMSGSAGNGSSSEDESSCSGIPAPIPSLWHVVRISRDASNDDNEPPSGPHPRLPPEMVILQQLRELREGNVVGAAAFMSKGRDSPAVAQAEMRSLLRKASHHVLLTHTSATLLQAGLPSETQFWQHVRLSRRTVTGYSSVEYVWTLSLARTGCWVVDDILPCSDISTAS